MSLAPVPGIYRLSADVSNAAGKKKGTAFSALTIPADTLINIVHSEPEEIEDSAGDAGAPQTRITVEAHTPEVDSLASRMDRTTLGYIIGGVWTPCKGITPRLILGSLISTEETTMTADELLAVVASGSGHYFLIDSLLSHVDTVAPEIGKAALVALIKGCVARALGEDATA